MPTNVTPEYKKAEEAYRKAREPKERLDCLREMLRTIPKHKGTDHLQADIKSRIKHAPLFWLDIQSVLGTLENEITVFGPIPRCSERSQ